MSACGRTDTDQLNVNLMELTLTTLLRPFAAKHRSGREEPKRQILLHSTGDESAGNAGCAFGTQRETVATLVFKGVHFFGHNIRGFAKRAGEHLGELEDRWWRSGGTRTAPQSPAPFP